MDSRDPLQNLTHAARESMQDTSVTPPMYLRYPCQPHYLEDSGEQLIKTQKSSSNHKMNIRIFSCKKYDIVNSRNSSVDV